MATQRDALPNLGLTGPELKAIALKEFEAMLDRDFAFKGSVSYKRVAFTISATFDLGAPHEKHELKSRAKSDGAVEGEAPLNPRPEVGVVVGLERDVALQNPNLDRIHHDLPIVSQHATPPRMIASEQTIPGEPNNYIIGQPGIEERKHYFDKAEFEAPAAPVDRDVSALAAAKLGVPAKVGMP